MIIKRARLWLCSVLATVIAIGVFTIWCYNDPKTRAAREFALTCERFMSTNSPYHEIDMAKVLDHMKRYFADMGTNAIPILVEWIEEAAAPQSTLKRQAGAFGKRMKIQSTRFWRWTYDGNVPMRAALAADILPLFKEQAVGAVPRLQQIARVTNTMGGIYAEIVLSRIEQIAAHPLPHSLNQTNR